MTLLRRTPRRTVVGAAILLLIALWFAGASSSGFWLGLAVLILVGGLIAAVRSRTTVRRIRRDLER